MRLSLILLVCMVSLFPLTVYLAVLSLINRRRHPLVVAGVWDAAGLILGSSGLLLVAGPCILSGFHERWRAFWLSSPMALRWRPLSEVNWYLWLSVWALYFLVVLCGSLLLLRRRRNVTSVYNIELGALEEVLGQVLDRLSLVWRHAGTRVIVAGNPAGDRLAIEVNPFPAMCHVSLVWPGADDPLRREIEAELAKVLQTVDTRENPAGLWLGSIAACLFTGMLLTLLFAVVLSVVKLWPV